MITTVVVTHNNIGYICEPWSAGFLCGKCHTPLPKMPPEVGDRCHKCGAVVSEIGSTSTTAKVTK